jgi:hypothetical protein
MLRRQDEINNILDLYDYIEVLEMYAKEKKEALRKAREDNR